MKTEDLKKDLKYLAKQGGLEDVGLDEHLNFCIQRGLADFWCGSTWSWSTRPYELTIASASAERHLIDAADFRGIRTVRHKEDTYGGLIEYLPKDDFDRRYPSPTAYTSGAPLICTAYYDRDQAAYYIVFNGPPDVGTVIYMDIFTTVGAVEAVPEGFESGLIASIEKYLYKPGSPERFSAQAYFQKEMVRLKNVDTPFKGYLSQVLQVFPVRRREGWQDIVFGPLA